jgi:hypothetical protein
MYEVQAGQVVKAVSSQGFIIGSALTPSVSPKRDTSPKSDKNG